MQLRRLALWMVVSIAAPRAAMGQELRGAVTDSASGQPVVGAVLLLLDSAGAVVTRNITNELGRYRVSLADGVRRVRFLRIGYRPHEVAIPASSNGIVQLDVHMTPVPAFLAPVHVVAGANCPRRSDRDAAFALWEQARDGLLATVVAREANPASLIRLRYERVRDGPSLEDRIVRQQVRLDSA
ncbi:MAG TPA: carboxypeptidase-like regulatory domain-containing protein, partial [Gemmatimonadaceae bacterium]|nr:carboxypeptidase-like regulatory domain-containing protein [Gemmatimonadaceae bacterium]